MRMAYAMQGTVLMILHKFEHLHITVLHLYTGLSGGSMRSSKLSEYFTVEVKTLDSGATLHSFKSCLCHLWQAVNWEVTFP